STPPLRRYTFTCGGVSAVSRLLSQPPSSSALPFFFTHAAATEIYTLSLHDALPISEPDRRQRAQVRPPGGAGLAVERRHHGTPRSEEHTSELQSREISYAVFCLKKKKEKC